MLGEHSRLSRKGILPMTPRMIMLLGIAVAIGGTAAMFLARRLGERRRAARGGLDDLARTGRTRDADGTTVRLLDPLPLLALGRHDVIDRESLEAVCNDLEPGVKGRRTIVLTAGLVTAGVVILVGAIIAIEGSPAFTDLVATVTNPAIIVCVLGGVVAPIIAARKERLSRVRAVMLGHRRCPHCGYGLTGVPPRDDRATVCPECASAWHVTDAAVVPHGPERSRNAILLATLVLGLAAFVAGVVAYLVVK